MEDPLDDLAGYEPVLQNEDELVYAIDAGYGTGIAADLEAAGLEYDPDSLTVNGKVYRGEHRGMTLKATITDDETWVEVLDVEDDQDVDATMLDENPASREGVITDTGF